MPQFSYRAVNGRGRTMRGSVAAANEVDLYQRLKETGLELIDCREAGTGRLAKLMAPRVAPRDVIQLCIHLTEMQRAGVPLLEGLNDIRDSTDSPRLRDIMTEICRDVAEGSSLSNAFSRHPDVFGFVFQALVSAGERTGNLGEAFGQIRDHLRWTNEMTQKIKKAIRYPLFTLFVSIAVIFFMMLFVVPKVVSFLESTSVKPPIMTRSLIATSNFFVEWWVVMIFGMIGFVVAVKVLARLFDGFAYRLDALWLKLPVLGPTIRKVTLSRFSHFFAVMFQSGIEIIECLDATRRIISNRVLREAIDAVQEGVRAGSPLSVAMGNTGEFPSLVIRMVRIGEQTGNLAETLDQVTAFYDREVNETIESLIGAIEPTLTFVVGIILGWIVMAIFGPLYDAMVKILVTPAPAAGSRP